MANTLDIHDYDLRLLGCKRKIEADDISDGNKKLILSYERARQLDGTAIATRIRTIYCLLDFAEFLGKDANLATKEEIKNFVCEIESRKDYGVYTKSKYKGVIKKFFKWLRYGDEYLCRDDYPEEVKWIRVHVKRKDEPKISRTDILTEDEIEKLIEAADHPRDKAFISMISDCGARIGEIGNLRIKDVYRDEFSFLVHLRGKTGEREDAVVYSNSYVAQWLNCHPLKNNRDAPLWVNLERGKCQYNQMKYGSFYKLCKNLFQKAGIKKKFNPHIFRHSRVTINLSKGVMNEAQAKAYFGWTPDSKMFSSYAHLVSQDANEAIRVAAGLKEKGESGIKMKPNVCKTCHYANSPEANFCERCGRPLNTKTQLLYSHMKSDAYEILDKLKGDPEFLALAKKKIPELYA